MKTWIIYALNIPLFNMLISQSNRLPPLVFDYKSPITVAWITPLALEVCVDAQLMRGSELLLSLVA